MTIPFPFNPIDSNSKLRQKTNVKISSTIEVSVIGNGYNFAFAATLFGIEGSTLSNVLINANYSPNYSNGLPLSALFVAFTRVKQASKVRFLPFLEKCTENLTHLLTLAHDPNTIRLANCYNSDGNFDLSLLVSAESKPEKDKKKAAAGQKNKKVSVTISESATAKVKAANEKASRWSAAATTIMSAGNTVSVRRASQIATATDAASKVVRLQKWHLQNTGLLSWQ